jgi:hypothetical protein
MYGWVSPYPSQFTTQRARVFQGVREEVAVVTSLRVLVQPALLGLVQVGRRGGGEEEEESGLSC